MLPSCIHIEIALGATEENNGLEEGEVVEEQYLNASNGSFLGEDHVDAINEQAATSPGENGYQHLDMSAVKVSHHRRVLGPKCHAPVDHSILDITQDVSSLGDDSLDSDDDDEESEANKSDYDENMRQSILSIFLSRSLTSSIGDNTGWRNDPFQSSILGASLDNEDIGASFEKE